jgi:hypothetical protein
MNSTYSMPKRGTSTPSTTRVSKQRGSAFSPPLTPSTHNFMPRQRGTVGSTPPAQYGEMHQSTGARCLGAHHLAWKRARARIASIRCGMESQPSTRLKMVAGCSLGLAFAMKKAYFERVNVLSSASTIVSGVTIAAPSFDRSL